MEYEIIHKKWGVYVKLASKRTRVKKVDSQEATFKTVKKFLINRTLFILLLCLVCNIMIIRDKSLLYQINYIVAALGSILSMTVVTKAANAKTIDELAEIGTFFGNLNALVCVLSMVLFTVRLTQYQNVSSVIIILLSFIVINAIYFYIGYSKEREKLSSKELQKEKGIVSEKFMVLNELLSVVILILLLFILKYMETGANVGFLWKYIILAACGGLFIVPTNLSLGIVICKMKYAK